MPYTAEAKDLMLNALKGTNPTTPITLRVRLAPLPLSLVSTLTP